METFEILLGESYSALERFVKFRINNRHDAEDIIQSVCLTACQKFEQLKDQAAFKSWLLAIARNRCNDYFREKAKRLDIPLDALNASALTASRIGTSERSVVLETLDLLGDKEKQILYLYFFKDLPQDAIARRLNVPIGTVKSRLHHAKKKFREKYPFAAVLKGDSNMNTFNGQKLPNLMPAYTIRKLDAAPFPVRFEEDLGWFIVPRLGEKCRWAFYDFPERICTGYNEVEVVGKAEVHGIEGVEIVVREYEPTSNTQHVENANPDAPFPIDRAQYAERRFVAQLTDTHCRTLAESHIENGIKKYATFLDGEAFLGSWGFGEDNCGNEVNLVPKGDIILKDDEIITADKTFLLDVIGRFEVTIGQKTFDTICRMDCSASNDGAVVAHYIDANGHTVLWRRFNSADWKFSRYQKLWTELLPENERLTINGRTYVHWYDCLTDYVLG